MGRDKYGKMDESNFEKNSSRAEKYPGGNGNSKKSDSKTKKIADKTKSDLKKNLNK